MKIKFLSEDALQDLRANFDSYKERYFNQDEQWFQCYFAKEGTTIESKIEYIHPAFSFNPDFSVSDFENVKAMYEALKHLTVAEATQERLWAGLAHMQMRDYFYFRLKEDIAKKNDKRLHCYS